MGGGEVDKRPGQLEKMEIKRRRGGDNERVIEREGLEDRHFSVNITSSSSVFASLSIHLSISWDSLAGCLSGLIDYVQSPHLY